MQCFSRKLFSAVLPTAALVLSLGLTTAHAQNTTAITPTGTFTFGSAQNSSLGFSFSLSTSINVTQLGFFDANNDGLAADHVVNIYDSMGATVVAGTVSNGTVNPLDNGFRYMSLSSPVILAPGTYVIGAATSSLSGQGGTLSDLYISSSSQAPTSSPEVTYIAGFERDGTGAGLMNPSVTPTATSTTGYFGPNFKYNFQGVTAAPEPGSLALLAPAMAVPSAVWLARRGRRRRRRAIAG